MKTENLEKYPETVTLSVPTWQADLLISLFNADGGDGFTDEEIEEAEQLINENSLLSLTDVSESVDGETTCTFITKF